MRKWTYLVAALLMSGATATFTSCIDTDEPAGIEDLRGAKAELLRAKVKVQEAEYEFRMAEAAWMQAKADYAAELAAQEALKTALQTEKNNKKIQEIKQEMQKSAEKFNAKMYELQAETEKQRLAYENALAQVELALSTLKDDIYAEKLNDLMYNAAFPYDELTYTVDAAGKVTVTTTPASIPGGLVGLSTKLATLKNELAEKMRDQALLEFSYDPQQLLTGVNQKIAEKEGEIKGYEEYLATLENVAGMTIDEFVTKFNEVKKQSEDIDDQIAEIELTKANDPDYQAVQEDQERLDQDKGLASAFTFSIPEAVQDEFYDVIAALKDDPSLVSSTELLDNLDDILGAASENEDGEHVFPNGFRLSLTTEDQFDLLSEIVNAIEDGVSYTPAGGGTAVDIEKKIFTEEELKVKDTQLVTAKSNYTALQTKLTAAETAWADALKNYNDAFETGNYANTVGESERDKIISEYNDFLADYTAATDPDKQAGLLDDFIKLYKDYLDVRTKLDGLTLPETADIIDDAAKYAAWALLSDAQKFGEADLTDVPAGEDYGYAGKLWEAAKTIGYDKTRLTLITYQEWEDADGTVAGLTASGLAEKTFEAKKGQDDLQNAIDNASVWATFDTALNTQSDALATTLAAFAERQANIDARKDAITEKYAAETAKLNVQKAGLEDIMDAMAAVMPNEGDENGAGVVGSPTADDFETLINNLEALIAHYRGVDVTVTPPTSGTSGSITTANPGLIPQAQQDLAMYTALKAALEAGTFEQEKDSLLNLIKAQVEGKNTEIEVVTALFEKASKQKDALMEALAGGDTSAE